MGGNGDGDGVLHPRHRGHPREDWLWGVRIGVSSSEPGHWRCGGSEEGACTIDTPLSQMCMICTLHAHLLCCAWCKRLTPHLQEAGGWPTRSDLRVRTELSRALQSIAHCVLSGQRGSLLRRTKSFMWCQRPAPRMHGQATSIIKHDIAHHRVAHGNRQRVLATCQPLTTDQ